MALKPRPVIIIGAPRSGTNMLRNALTALPGFATWPCDEINYIWRHGNVRYPSDELPPERARARIQRYVRRQFDWVGRRYGAEVVVEKTCANSLRVGFVDRVLPEARYIFIKRDGMDAVASALERWQAPLDLSYVARKARFVPLLDMPYYASRYIWNHAYRWVSGSRRLAFWGPRLEDMDRLLTQHSLEEVCALQWRRCVEAAGSAFGEMSPGRFLDMRYEDVVSDPAGELRRILAFLELDVSDDVVTSAVSGVEATRGGRGRERLGRERSERVLGLIGETMSRYGYA